MKKFLQSIGKFLVSIFQSQYALVQKYAEVAVKVTNILKTIVESPLTGMVIQLTPTDADDKVLAKLRVVIPEVAQRVAIIHGITVRADGTNHEVLEAIVSYVKSLPIEGKAMFWVQFAGELNKALADGKLSWNEAILLSQMAYAQLPKGAQ